MFALASFPRHEDPSLVDGSLSTSRKELACPCAQHLPPLPFLALGRERERSRSEGCRIIVVSHGKQATVRQTNITPTPHTHRHREREHYLGNDCNRTFFATHSAAHRLRPVPSQPGCLCAGSTRIYKLLLRTMIVPASGSTTETRRIFFF